MVAWLSYILYVTATRISSRQVQLCSHSRDNMKSHDEFKAKLELPFELIADTKKKCATCLAWSKTRSCTERRSRALSAEHLYGGG